MGKAAKKKIIVTNPNNDGHARTVMIVLIVAIVLALILAGVAIFIKKQSFTPQPDGTIAGTKSITGYAEPAEFSQGKGLWFKGGKLLSNAEIQNEAMSGTKVLEYYFDYTCNICNDVENLMDKGKQLEHLVEDGKALVVLRPTLTHAAPFAPFANNLIYWTAKNKPEKTWKLAKSLAEYAINTYKSADYENKQNDEEWKKQVMDPETVLKKIAKENGIDYSKVPPASKDSGSLPIMIYQERRMTALGQDTAGTPLYIANGKIVKLSGFNKDHKFLQHATL